MYVTKNILIIGGALEQERFIVVGNIKFMEKLKE